MNGEEVLAEMDQLISSNDIDPDTAMRLIIAGQKTIIKRLERYHDDISDITERIRVLEEVQQHYPSMLWLWANDRKNLIIILLVLMFVYTLLFGWLTVSDIRQILLDHAGIPAP